MPSESLPFESWPEFRKQIEISVLQMYSVSTQYAAACTRALDSPEMISAWATFESWIPNGATYAFAMIQLSWRESFKQYSRADARRLIEKVEADALRLRASLLEASDLVDEFHKHNFRTRDPGLRKLNLDEILRRLGSEARLDAEEIKNGEGLIPNPTAARGSSMRAFVKIFLSQYVGGLDQLYYPKQKLTKEFCEAVAVTTQRVYDYDGDITWRFVYDVYRGMAGRQLNR